MSTHLSTARRSIRRHLAAAAATIAVLAGGLGGWAMTTELSGAVIASGVLVVDTSVKKVQHPTGGVVGELRVRNGDRVRAGDVVVRLDDTVTRANLAIVTKGLDELAARQARLEAEREDAATIAFPEALTARQDDPEIARIMAGERSLFELRRSARLGQKGQLREKIAQLQDEIVGLAGQADAKKREIELIKRELQGVRELWSKNLVPISRLTALEREAARLDGEREQYVSAVAQAKGKTAEIKLQMIQVDQDLRSEVANDLRDIQAKSAELVERKVAARDQLMRIDIRAPQDGIVHQLAVHTVGGVVTASEPLMLIVPDADDLAVEAKLPPQNIDQLSVGQRATLRFPAFNQRTTPEITGVVATVSADTAQDQKTGAAYYVVRITMAADEIARLNGQKLVPGMPVEAFIQTGDRTVMSFLVKPLQDQIIKAFRER
jgi:membrane fusion protein, type I secretion system